MNLRKLAPLGRCPRCELIKRCRPVGDSGACTDCVAPGNGDGELDRFARQTVAADGGRSK